MKVVLGRCIDNSPYAVTECHEDDRLATVHAVLEAERISHAIDDHYFYDLPDNRTLNTHLTKLDLQQTDTLLYFVRQPSANLSFTIRWLKRIRRKGFAGCIALAGDVGYLDKQRLLEVPIDYILYGDPGSVSNNLLRLHNGLSLEKGFATRCGDKLIDIPLDRPLCPSEQVPPPKFYGLKFADKGKAIGREYVPRIRTSHGCYANCSFCHESSRQYTDRNYYHYRLPEANIKASIKAVYDAGQRRIVFQDSNFLPPKALGDDWVDWFSSMVRTDFPDLHYSFWSRITDITPQRMDLLCSTNLVSVLCGIESLNPDRLKAYRKGYVPEDVDRGLEILNAHNIEGKLSFILFDPTLDLEDVGFEIKQMARIIREYPRVIRRPLFSYNLLSIYPGSPLYEKYLREGFISDDRGDKSGSVWEHSSYLAHRRAGYSEIVYRFRDEYVEVLCEILRTHQYEYSQKWYEVIRLNRMGKASGDFFRGIAPRMIRNMAILHELCTKLKKDRISLLDAQQRLADALYTLVLADYEKSLPATLRVLKTPEKLGYGANWKTTITTL